MGNKQFRLATPCKWKRRAASTWLTTALLRVHCHTVKHALRYLTFVGAMHDVPCFSEEMSRKEHNAYDKWRSCFCYCCPETRADSIYGMWINRLILNRVGQEKLASASIAEINQIQPVWSSDSSLKVGKRAQRRRAKPKNKNKSRQDQSFSTKSRKHQQRLSQVHPPTALRGRLEI